MLDGTEFFECECSSDEHTLRMTLDLDELEDPEHRMPCIFTSVYLGTNRNFWQRLWYGLKYAFGYQSRYGAFYCWRLNSKDIDRLKVFLHRLSIAKVEEKNQ